MADEHLCALLPPPAAIVPLAGQSLLAAVEAPRRRAALLAFLSPGRRSSACSARRSAKLQRHRDRARLMPPQRRSMS
jgi:hypothetical protein